MTNPDIHFGATLGLGIESAVAEATLLESLGYEYVGAGEHFMRGNPPGPSSANLPLLAVAAGATSSIKIVPSVLLIPFYHPTMLAKFTNTLDIASGGRLILGVGVGGEYPVEFEAAGIKASQRGRRADECLESLRRLWTEEHVSFAGRYYNLNDVTIVPGPAQEPHPPIWVAGRRDAAMRRAVKYAEGWFPYLYSPERYRDSVDKIHAFAEEAGRDLTEFQWTNFQFICIGDSKEEAAVEAARTLAAGYTYSGDFLNIVGSYCVLGTVEQCIERIQEYVDAGARHFLFSWASRHADRPRQMEIAATEIIPHFKR